MKKLQYLLLTLLLLAACGDPVTPPEPSQDMLSVTPATLSFSTYESSTQRLSVQSSGKWTLSVGNGGSWCQPDSYSGSGNGTVNVTASANATTLPRTTTITFSGQGGTTATVEVTQVAGKENPVRTNTVALSAAPKAWDGQKRADITYQLLVYSFADGKGGDRWGDLQGVTDHLDYLDGLGASALWLSPIQSATSYHGYDINNYNEIDPHLGTESDFQTLIGSARSKGIDIYMDYVLNHSGTGTTWFQDALGDASSPYRNWYVFSDNPTSDVSGRKIDNFAGASDPGMGEWHPTGVGMGYKGRLHFKVDWSGSAKTVTVSKSSDAPQTSNASASIWLWIGSAGAVGLYPSGGDTHEITLDVDTDWGFLVRTTGSSTDWSAGTKWGTPSGGKAIVFDSPFTLASNASGDPGNIVFSDSSSYYFASFDGSMPDLNYGPAATAALHPCFQALAASADKWINMGVNGLRLDADIWIYQRQTDANVAFLRQWYDHCNATYKARGGQGDIYMVGESWTDTAEECAPYYEGLPSHFNFWYWYTLKDRISNGKGNDFAATVRYFRDLFHARRSGFIDAIKLTNHDENRAASDLNRSLDKEKLAAAVLLTSPGKPFIYQGEELGYWGTNRNGQDEWRRAPIKWTRTGTLADAPLMVYDDRVDRTMLTADISVEAQEADAGSLLNVYKTFARLRNSYVSLASGEISEHGTYNASNSRFAGLGAWYRTTGSEKTLVVHNFSGAKVTASFGTEDLSRVIGLNGGGEVKTTTTDGVLTDNTLTLNAYSSAVFLISE
ncbi:MAG: alpha-amylase [Bacteroidales bacterium]|nr:alpha-amylase [Bacteroidales bacterium]